MSQIQPHPDVPGLWQARCDDAAVDHAAIIDALATAKAHPAAYQTHHLHGRFENTYVPADQIPPLQPLIDWIASQARAALDRDALRYGFWFNEMGPGHRTSRHHHEEDDELLSAVYYLRIPADSGRFVLWHGEQDFRIDPEEGLLLMFSPALDHEVEENRSNDIRLSVAFNFGPPLDEAD